MPGRGDDRVPGPLFANVPAARDLEPAASVEGEPRAETETAPPGEPAAAPAPGGEPTAPEPRSDKPPAEPPAGPERHAAASGAAAVGTLDTVSGRLVDSTIWINDAHPAYTRAAASRSSGYHTALAVALALAPLAVEPHDEHGFITQFLAHWGGAQAATGRRRRRAGKGT
jgi:hypothetical protein